MTLGHPLLDVLGIARVYPVPAAHSTLLRAAHRLADRVVTRPALAAVCVGLVFFGLSLLALGRG